MDLEKLQQKTVDEFMHIVTIGAKGFEEQPVIDYIVDRLKGVDVDVDVQPFTAKDFNQSSSNIVVHLKATDPSKEAIFFDGHMDTVPNGIGIEPMIENGIIRPKGKTILGGDDRAAIAGMIIAMETILDENIPHGDVYFIMSAAEEIGQVGAQYINFDKMNVKYGFVLDGEGNVGRTSIIGPSFFNYEIDVIGRGAHAGIAPEKGLNAIKVAAELIKDLPQGKINDDFITNVGTIEGGSALNVVAPSVHIEGEARAFSAEVEDYIMKTFPAIIEKHKPDAVDIKLNLYKDCAGYFTKENDPVAQKSKEALLAIGIPEKDITFEKSAGGTSANIYADKGISCITLSIGEEEVHTTKEYISVKNLGLTTQMILKIIELM